MDKNAQSLTFSRRSILGAAAGTLGAMSVPGNAFGTLSGAAPEVRTHLGTIRGFSDNGISVFKGIRYGADTRPRRFRPPLSPVAWEQVADTVEYGASCPQSSNVGHMDEDCLFLNIWSPELDDGARLPVMFYIHGGAYSNGSGSSPLYDGAALAKRGNVVVVTVNHRLNAFGYLYLQRLGDERFADSGNCGQLDLILALEWVQKNIARFGGDPDKVLAFGQSGGGAKIATMMATPAAGGLFHRAASMSGQQVTASGPANATLRSRAYLDAIGIGVDETSQLATMPTDKLVPGLAAGDPVLGYGPVYFGPVLDMRSIQRHPFYPDAAPQSAHIPMIIGNTRDETRAFLREPELYELDWQDLPDLLISNMRVDIRPEFVVDEYRRLYPDQSPSDIFFKATTAARSWRGAVIEAEERAKAGRGNTFAYQLNWGSPVQPELGAPHGFDIPLVFGNLDADRSLTGSGNNAQEVSAMLSDAFINFAYNGVPTAGNLPVWKPYTLPGRETMVIDLPARLENDPRGAERELFARVPYVQPGT
jgi:para-nitrobenzyl esterase